MEGLEGKGREERGGLKECRWELRVRCGAVPVRCGAGGAVSGIWHFGIRQRTRRRARGMGNEEGRASGGLLGVLAPEWHGAVQCGASSASACTATGQWAQSPAPRRAADRRRVLNGVAEGREIPGGVLFWEERRRHGGASRPPSLMRGPASESQPANRPANPACFACTHPGPPRPRFYSKNSLVRHGLVGRVHRNTNGIVILNSHVVS